MHVPGAFINVTWRFELIHAAHTQDGIITRNNTFNSIDDMDKLFHTANFII